MKPELIVVGSHAPALSIKVKRIPRAGETVLGWDFQEPMDGGKGSNQAIAASRLGGKVSFVGCVGKDKIGMEGKQWLEDAGVDTTYLRLHETVSTGVGFLILDEQSVPIIVTSMGANAEISTAEVDHSIHKMKDAKVLLTQLEIPFEVALHAARTAKNLGMVSILNPAPAMENILQDLDSVSILVPNESEAKTLLGLDIDTTHDPMEMAVRLQRISKCDCVIITLGEEGVVGTLSSGERWKFTPPHVSTIDTTGAGDAFCAGLSVGLSKGMSAQKASEWACYVAALSVIKPGTIPSYPTIDDVNKFIEDCLAA